MKAFYYVFKDFYQKKKRFCLVEKIFVDLYAMFQNKCFFFIIENS